MLCALQLASEKRARNAERAALESKIQRLELSLKASEASGHQGHLSLFSDVRYVNAFSLVRAHTRIAAEPRASNHESWLTMISRPLRAKLVSELSYSIPDAKVLMGIIQDIDKHLSEQGVSGGFW